MDANDIVAELTDLERSLTLRRMLWEAVEEWNELTSRWMIQQFDTLDVDNLQQSVGRITQTIMLLEKGRLKIAPL